MHESEAAFQAVVDPYARADFFISFGEEGVNLEEGFITFTSLPGGLLTKVGKMRAAFGKVNTLHNHVLPWADRPLVINNLVGGEDGIDDAGISVARLIPEPVDVPRSDRAGLPRRFRARTLFNSSERGDLSYVGHLRGYQDITESSNIDLGLSRTRTATTAVGRSSTTWTRARFTTKLYGIDATYRWKPLQRSIYHSFVGRTEWIWSRRDQPDGLQSAMGYYVSGDYQFGRRWFAGVRYDRSDRADDASLLDTGSRSSSPTGRASSARCARSIAAPTTRWGRQPTSSCSSSSSRSARTARTRFRVHDFKVLKVQGSYEKSHRCSCSPRAAVRPSPARAQGKLNVMTTTEDLASIAREVGGDHITVESIARGYQDPHFVEAKPSFILKLQKADLLVVVGRELEIGWLPPLIQQSRNAKIQPGRAGYLDASLGATILEIPTGQITRAMGDVHPLGNPHYWMDPENGKRIAKEIADKLSELRPNDRAYFQQQLADFTTRLDAAEKRWLAQMAPYKGTKVVTYHRSFPNFAERFGLDIVGYVEPKPGIPPTPQHTLDLINEMKRQNVKLVLVEPYFDLKTPNAIGRDTGAQVLVMPPSVGGVKDVTDYFKLFDYDINLLVDAIKKSGAK